jgi:hypothetical protein
VAGIAHCNSTSVRRVHPESPAAAAAGAAAAAAVGAARCELSLIFIVR